MFRVVLSIAAACLAGYLLPNERVWLSDWSLLVCGVVVGLLIPQWPYVVLTVPFYTAGFFLYIAVRNPLALVDPLFLDPQAWAGLVFFIFGGRWIIMLTIASFVFVTRKAIVVTYGEIRLWRSGRHV